MDDEFMLEWRKVPSEMVHALHSLSWAASTLAEGCYDTFDVASEWAGWAFNYLGDVAAVVDLPDIVASAALSEEAGVLSKFYLNRSLLETP